LIQVCGFLSERFLEEEVYLVELSLMSQSEVRALITEWLPRSKLRHVADALHIAWRSPNLLAGIRKRWS
jgi:hypothetical protein